MYNPSAKINAIKVIIYISRELHLEHPKSPDLA